MRPLRRTLTGYKVLIRFTHLEPIEDFIEVKVFAENKEIAERNVLKEFWRSRSAEPLPAVEIDHITITQT
jgi:hypothetical protein